MKSRFVSAVKPTDYANRLHDIQTTLQKMEAEIKLLESEEKHLQNYLIRFAKAESFKYVGKDGYEMVVKIREHSRLILDQEKVQKMLKSRTPYKPSSWTTVRVDYVYE